MPTLSPKKANALEKLRSNVRDVWKPEFAQDSYLLRWLRARNFDAKKAERMLRSHLEWRRQYGADNILDDPQLPEVVLRFYPGGFCGGHSKEGQPLWVDPTGYSDMKGLVKSASFYDLLRSRIFILESVHKQLLPRASVEAGHPVETTAVIFDLERFGTRHMWKPGLDVFIEVTKMCEANYPETMGKCFIVNAPALFPALYQLVKPFLHEATINKIQVLGSNYKETLLKYFDKEQLPVRYGGTLCDENGSGDCRARICFGGTVPRSLYVTCDRSTMEEMTVPRGGVVKIKKNVPSVGYVLSWVFTSEDHDIAFGVNFTNSATQDPLVIRESRRTISHIVPERGRHQCCAAGVYVFRFDNSYSWTRQKRLWVRIECLTAEEDQRQRQQQQQQQKERAEEQEQEGEEEEEEEEYQPQGAENGATGDAVSVDSFYSARSSASEQ